MSDPLDQLLAESNPSEDDPCEAGRKAFEEALERVKTIAKCMPDDKEDLADEKNHWTFEWDASLQPLWDALTAARKLGAEAKIDKPVLLEFKNLKATSARWKEEAQWKTRAMDVPAGSLVAPPDAPPAIISSTGSTSASALSSRREVSMMTRPDKVHVENQGDASTQRTCDDAQETTLNVKPDDPEAIQHDPPCDRCVTAAVPCWGVPGRVCEHCKLVSQRCTKSGGRGGLRAKRKRDTDGDGDGDAEQAPEASKPQRVRNAQKRRVSSPPKDAQDDDVVEVIDTPSVVSKGKKKAQLSKPSRSSKPSVVIPPINPTMQPKPSVVIPPINPTMQPKPSKPSILVKPLLEKPNPTTDVPKEFLKTLGELESLALLASAEVKRAQAESKKAEGTLDVFMSEIRSFRTKHDL